jgi:uncharacterized membrane protein
MFDAPLATGVIVMLAAVAVDWLGRMRRFRAVGAAMLALFVGAALANLRVIPPATAPHPVYDFAFAVVAPLMIFLLLLEARLASLRRAGMRMLSAFVLGVAGTLLGVVVALRLVPGREALERLEGPLAGMVTATFIGGSANLNALALHYDVVSHGSIYGGAVAVINAITAVWMAWVLAAPALLGRFRWWPAPCQLPIRDSTGHAKPARVVQLPDSLDIALPLTLGLSAMLLSNAAAALLEQFGVPVPPVLILTTLALAIAQLEWSTRLTLARPLALVSVNAFLVVVGASADLVVLKQQGALVAVLSAFVAIVLVVHGLVVYGVGALLRIDLGTLSCASFANIGGPATVPAVAEGIGREDLILPAVLAGVLGAAIGTYAGFVVVATIE